MVEAVVTGYRSIRKLYESPDTIDIPELDIYTFFEDPDARPFCYINDKDTFYIHNQPVMHVGLINDTIRNYIAKNKLEDNANTRVEVGRLLGFYDNRGYPLGINGRIWTQTRTMSFWDYPTVDEFKKILNHLSNNGVKINDKWRVEVYLPNDVDSTLIPIGEYNGKAAAIHDDRKAELDKMREQHTMSPIEKEKEKRNSPPKELPVKKVETGGLSMAEYNFKKNQARGD